jgi:very-short-patch-repair endonuclease/type II restriction/modification system DNA methylase subunit YeeA
MDTNTLEKFAQQARRDLLAQVAARLTQVLSTDSVALREKLGAVNELRKQIEAQGRDHVIEKAAYIWFNRFCALRYMDVNHITRIGVVSPAPGFTQPEMLQNAKQGIFDPAWQVDKARVQGLLNGSRPSDNPEQEAYRLLVVAVCNSYAREMPFLFTEIVDYIQLLMPEDLLSSQSVLQSVRETLTEETCQDVEVIGWLYQFYISEKKDEVMGQKGRVDPEDIPAVTQLFTPDWIVRYMVQNSLGRLWLLNHPESAIRDQMAYYIDDSLTPTLSRGERGPEAESPRPREIGNQDGLPGGVKAQVGSSHPDSKSPRPSGEEQHVEGQTDHISPRPLGEGQNDDGQTDRKSPRPLGEGQGEGQRGLSKEMLHRCRELRKNATDAEQLLWSCLRNRALGGYKFRRQHPVGDYILDFYCHEARLCIELDGGGHGETEQAQKDAERTAFLETQGIRVVRYWNHEVLTDLEVVLEDILNRCDSLTPTLSRGERGQEAEPPHPLEGGQSGGVQDGQSSGGLPQIDQKSPRPRETGNQDGLHSSKQAQIGSSNFESSSPRPLGEGQGEGSFLKVDTPEELKILDPACGSGHILTYAFDLLYAIYEERGYDPPDIPRLILENNLYGIEIDKRAAMLASFALMMKAVAKDRHFFNRKVQPHILEMENITFDAKEIKDYMAKVGEDLWTQELWEGLRQFEEAKTYGSLIRPALKDVPELRQRLAAKGVFEDLFLAETNRKVQLVLRMSEFLSRRYQVVVANPPYFSKGMDSDYKQFAKDHYPDSKRDTLSMFTERNLDLARRGGYVGMVTLMSWMFLSSFEKFREKLLRHDTIMTMAHLGARAFDTIGGEVVSTTMFVLKNKHLEGFKGAYFRLVEGDSESEKKTALVEAIANPDCGWFFRADASGFTKIPGAPIAYWASRQSIRVFEEGTPLSKFANPRKGMVTADNSRFIRYWFEPSLSNLAFHCKSREEAKASNAKWFPYMKGGAFRRWSGNQEFVVNWENDGFELLHMKEEGYKVGSTNHNLEFIFNPAITWTKITSSKPSFRISGNGYLYDDASGLCPVHDDINEMEILGVLNSRIIIHLLELMNPTLNLNPGNLSDIPIILDDKHDVKLKRLVEISESDWDSYETSWKFNKSIFLELIPDDESTMISDTYEKIRLHWQKMSNEMRELEIRNNKNKLAVYDLRDELETDIPLDEISLICNPNYRYNGDLSEEELEARLLEDTMKEFISYAVGCMFGRYALEKPGLILANQGQTVKDYVRILQDDSLTALTSLTPALSQRERENRCEVERGNGREVARGSLLPVGEGQDEGKTTPDLSPQEKEQTQVDEGASPLFPPTETNVIPIVGGDWFADDILAQFKRFLRVTFGDAHYAENLAFIESALGKDLEKYFLRDFYKDHVKMYKKRPIYWLFSSPKGSFNALIYMHRYRPETASVVLNQYLRAYRDKLTTRREHLEALSVSESATKREQSRALKESEAIGKVLTELRAYEDEILFPLAGQRIEIDLDDGVKVNYAKFGKALKKI